MPAIGLRIYGLGVLALGLVGLAYGDFALQWQPAPAGLPGRQMLAYAVAIAFVVGGVALNWRRTAAMAGAVLGVLFGLNIVLFHGPLIVRHAGQFAVWSGAAEQLALVVGALLVYAADAPPEVATRLVRLGRLAFGVCLLAFGAAHFAYLGFTAGMVPKWLPPGQVFWAAATGVAHIAAGLALLSGVQARLAAWMVTAMFAVFGLLVHAPLLMGDPASHLNWVGNAINLSLTGAAWVLADAVSEGFSPPKVEA